MDITAAMVKELRELTGAGIMACKKALVDIQKKMKKAAAELNFEAYRSIKKERRSYCSKEIR